MKWTTLTTAIGLSLLGTTGGVAADINLMPNPGAEDVMAKAEFPKTLARPQAEMAEEVPQGWGCYVGDGCCTWGSTAKEAHTGKKSAFLTFTKYGTPSASLDLLLGKSDGYNGSEAFDVKPDTRYYISFWIKGDVSFVKVRAIGWTTKEAVSKDRDNPTSSFSPIRPTSAWQEYEGYVTTRSTTKKLVVGINLGGADCVAGQTFYVDDVTMREMTADTVIKHQGVKLVTAVRPDRPEALYTCGEQATFLIDLTEDGQPVKQGKVTVALIRDGTELIERKTLTIGKDPLRMTATLSEPGFLRCMVTYTEPGSVGVGFEPTRIHAQAVMPSDFDAFWDAGKAKLAAIPLDCKLEFVPKFSTPSQETFKISFANINDTRIYGWLSMPKGKKPPYPAYVNVPSAGPGPEPEASMQAWATKGVLALCMSVHTYDCSLPPDEINALYKELNKAETYTYQGAPDRERYYFRRAILGIDRAINYLASRPDFDGRHLVMDGSSQGGAFALIMAGLNRHITAAAASEPGLCDEAAYLARRTPGWPQLASVEKGPRYLEMSAYFDAVNFARKIKCPTIVAVGFIDHVCSPSSVYAAYNEIAAPKRIFNAPSSDHSWNVGGGYRAFESQWLAGQLGLGDSVPPVKPE